LFDRVLLVLCFARLSNILNASLLWFIQYKFGLFMTIVNDLHTKSSSVVSICGFYFKFDCGSPDCFVSSFLIFDFDLVAHFGATLFENGTPKAGGQFSQNKSDAQRPHQKDPTSTTTIL